MIGRTYFRAVTVSGTVTAMRNPLGDPQAILEHVYVEAPDRNGVIPSEAGIVPELLARVQPLHQVIDVDVFLPGCPPSADLIYTVLDDLLSGRVPEAAGARFGR